MTGFNASEIFGSIRGQLKVLIGAAPGVGKTYTMLREARALKERGIDVVIGYIDIHDRKDTAAQIGELEVLPRKNVRYHHRVFEEVDLEAIVHRNPEVVVIDELAHSNTPLSRFSKRYKEVEFLLNQGISVLTAVNVQHIEGIHKEAEEVTGIRVRELIPEAFIKRAIEVSVIDVTPETLRQRLRDGSIYSQDKVNQALQNFFRKSNLAGLRELALRVVAEDVDERLERSFSRRKIPGPVGAKEVILACVHHYDRAVQLIERGSRMSERLKGDLYVLTIMGDDLSYEQGSDRNNDQLSMLRQLTGKCNAQWIVQKRNDRQYGEIILEVSKQLNVTQIVVGQPLAGKKWRRLWKHNLVQYLLRNLRYTDLRIVGWIDVSLPPKMSLKLTSQGKPIDDKRSKGRLTIYIGASPGVGKTYKLLQDAHDWIKRGWDVVIGLIETHGREETAKQIGNLEMIPKNIIEYEGRVYEELNVNAILQRRPFIVLIDELAHSNVPGSIRKKRYQDIEYLLDQGINVVTAVNIQHLESLHDKVEHITGIKVRERVPDSFMKLAREVKLIDVTPETLQLRLQEGLIYSRDKVQQALDNFFQTANLAALRELSLLEVADDVDSRIIMARDRKNGHVAEPERILVCVNHKPHSEKLLRRGWRIADRLKAELWVLVVLTEDRLSPQDERDLERIQQLSEEFDANFMTRQAVDQNVGVTIVNTAKELHVTQLVAGQPSKRLNFLVPWKQNPIVYVLEHAEFVDFHIVAHTRADEK